MCRFHLWYHTPKYTIPCKSFWLGMTSKYGKAAETPAHKSFLALPHDTFAPNMKTESLSLPE